MPIINLTPHPVRILDANNNLVKEYPSQGSGRIPTQAFEIKAIDGVPIFDVVFLYSEFSLPEEKESVFYIVSNVVHNKFPERFDLLTPFDLVRDEKGNTIGCRACNEILDKQCALIIYYSYNSKAKGIICLKFQL